HRQRLVHHHRVHLISHVCSHHFHACPRRLSNGARGGAAGGEPAGALLSHQAIARPLGPLAHDASLPAHQNRPLLHSWAERAAWPIVVPPTFHTLTHRHNLTPRGGCTRWWPLTGPSAKG